MAAREQEEARLRAFDAVLEQDHLQGQWKADRFLETVIGGPKPAGVPYLWRWELMERRLKEAVEAMPESFTARRHLACVNPGLSRPGTTHTIWAGFQWVQPGELAWAHRHTISALRFVVQGHSGAYTVVDGDVCPMQAGDLILTPRWTWHDHHNPTSEPVIWLDVLDLGLVTALNATFYEPLGEAQQTVREPGSEWFRRWEWVRPAWEAPVRDRLPVRYPWQKVLEQWQALEGHPGSRYDGLALEYVNPMTGGPAMPTLSCWAQQLPPGFEGLAHRHTASAVYYVIEGEGATEVGDVTLEWGARDLFVVPNWAWHRHRNRSKEHPARLFVVQDIPMLAAFGLYYEEPEESVHQMLPPPAPTVSRRKLHRPDAFLRPLA